jgi:hypothetical protein
MTQSRQPNLLNILSVLTPMPRFALFWLLLLALGDTLLAQSAGQFYANDKGEYGWTENSKSKLRSTTWFAKHPSDSATYRQITAVIYDDKPNAVLYLDRASKRVVGRLDLESQKFALLPASDQKLRQAIDKFKFPTAGELPRIEEMFEPLPDAQPGNGARLQLPPPTLQFPQLQHSTWETSYMSADKFLIRSILQLDGERGTYRLTQKPGTGQLSNVQYEREGDEHIIRGNWNLGRSNGQFKFNIPADNLNVFWGEFSFQNGKPVGAWSGVRKLIRPSKELQKPVR